MTAGRTVRFHAPLAPPDETVGPPRRTFHMSRPDPVARNLANACLSGDWAEDGMVERGGKAVGRRYRFLRPLVRRLLAAFAEPPDADPLAAAVAADDGFGRAVLTQPLRVARVFVVVPRMRQPRFQVAAGLPQLATVAALADWLGVAPARLDWLADLRSLNRRSADPLRTYGHRWVPKPRGAARLVESPRPLLKRVQRTLLHGLLDLVPPHDAAHGFRAGRSVVTNAAPHCGRAVVLKFDLADFFPGVAAGRARAVYRSLGYPPEVARVLTALCTTRTPRGVWDARPNPPADGSDHAIWQRLNTWHLPQGAPTSPALANLAAYRLDCRLAGLAADLGATYTRYADDLTLSGGDELRESAARLRRLVATIAAAEGFVLNIRKSRVQGRAGRQAVCGVVVNVRPNPRRADFDTLNAILTNCVRHGPGGQNRAGVPDFRAHLQGRVSQMAMLNPARGRKLWAVFDRIAWPACPAAPTMPAWQTSSSACPGSAASSATA